MFVHMSRQVSANSNFLSSPSEFFVDPPEGFQFAIFGMLLYDDDDDDDDDDG